MGFERGNIEKGMLIRCLDEKDMLATMKAYRKEGVITRRADREDGLHNLIVVDFERKRR